MRHAPRIYVIADAAGNTAQQTVIRAYEVRA
jgi:hypothetical protein